MSTVSYGGQAVLEGVMMRGPAVWSVAVRTPAGEVVEVTKQVSSPMQRHRIWRVPVIRGVVALGESLAIGFRALAISANYAMQQEPEEGEEAPQEVSTEISRGQIIFSFVIAIGFALMLFKVGPALLTSWLPIDGTYTFVVVEGLIRVSIFIAYIVLIGLLPDLKRVFQYHGAEHKAINALEGGSELTPEKVQKFSLIHPRCGTAFLLWVMVIGIFVFAFVGRPTWYWLILSRILLLPVIAGPRLRAHPLCRQAPGQPRPDDGARAGALAAAADDAGAVARPDRGLDPRPRGGHARRAVGEREELQARVARRGHGVGRRHGRRNDAENRP